MSHTKPHWLHVATIGSPHGVRGDVTVRCFMADPMDLGTYGALQDETGKAFVLEPLRSKGPSVIARVEGVSSRNEVEALKGCKLYLDRAVLPEPDEEEFYYADLVGLRVLDDAGAEWGEIAAVQNYGAGDLLEVRPLTGKTVFVPFTRAAVPDVSIAGGFVTAMKPDEAGETSAEEG